MSENKQPAAQWANNTQCRRAAKQIAATYTHRSFFIYIYAGHKFGKHHVAAQLESILGSAAEFVSSLVNTATAPVNADWSHAAQSTNSTKYMVPFISFTYTQGTSLLPRQFSFDKTLVYSQLLPLTASYIEVMHMLGLSLTTVFVYRSSRTMATASTLANPLGFWLAQMPTRVCTCPCV